MVSKASELRETIRAGERWNDELQFQIMRLENHVVSRTDEEKEYHARLLDGYQTAIRYGTVLLNYLKGRMDRLTRGEDGPDELPPSVMEDGRVAPVFEDQEK